MEWERFFSVFGIMVVSVLFGAFVSFESTDMVGCPKVEVIESRDLGIRRR